MKIDDSQIYSLDALVKFTRIWADERNLIEGSTPQQQFCKLIEEVGELATSINKKLGNERVKDDIGDCLVVLIILASQSGLNVRECLQHAYNEIKDRKGKMVDGIFIKENDQDKPNMVYGQKEGYEMLHVKPKQMELPFETETDQCAKYE